MTTPTKEHAPKKRRTKKTPARKVAVHSVRHAVAIDEPTARVESRISAVSLEQSDGVDAMGEELAEAYIENVTGADDAATEHRAETFIEEDGGPFVTTTGGVEFAEGTDASNPADATREPRPTV